MLLLVTLPSFSTTILSFTADTANSSNAAFGSSVQSLVNDAFAYNPLDPTSTSPEVNTVAELYHAQQGDLSDVILTYDTSHTFSGTDNAITVDMWSRGGESNQDDDFDIAFYNSSGALLSELTGLGIDGAHSRFVFTGFATNDVVSQMVITGRSSWTDNDGNPGSSNDWQAAELKAYVSTVPEPSSALLMVAGCSALVIRRRR